MTLACRSGQVRHPQPAVPATAPTLLPVYPSGVTLKMKLSAVLLLALLACLLLSAVSGGPAEGMDLDIDADIGEVEVEVEVDNDMDGPPPTTTTTVSQLRIGTLFRRCQLRSVSNMVNQSVSQL